MAKNQNIFTVLYKKKFLDCVCGFLCILVLFKIFEIYLMKLGMWIVGVHIYQPILNFTLILKILTHRYDILVMYIPKLENLYSINTQYDPFLADTF